MSKSKDILHIYTRVSTDQQMTDGTSLDSQLQFGLQKAKSLGMEFEHHDERSASSSKDHLDNRPVIRELLARISEGEIKHIYIYSLDRLSRNTTTSTFIRETLRKNGCTLYTNTNETNLESHEQNLLFGIISEISQYENMLRKERLNHGKRVKARQGYWMGGPTPFGYKKSTRNKLILDKEQSEWVERIFRWYSEGMSPMRIKRKLNGNVLTNRGNPIWSDGSVNAILRNTHPSGTYTYYEKEIDCPRIVDQETWDKVHSKLANKKRMQRGRQIKIYDYPLREIMFCDHCGTQMGGRSHSLKSGVKRTRYLCVHHNKKYKESSVQGDWKRNKYCENNSSLESGPTEDTIWTTLLEILRLSHQEREIFKKSLLKQKKMSDKSKKKEIDLAKGQIAKTNETICLLEERIVEKQIEKISSREKAKSIQSFIDQLQAKVDGESSRLIVLENDLSNLENSNLWIHWVNDYECNIDKLTNLSRDKRIEEVKKYIKRIDVTFNKETRNHRLELHFRLPLIGDSLKWKDKQKNKGYSISKGNTEKVVYLERGEHLTRETKGLDKESQIVL
ncbi:MAG: recombinase family protein [Porticoccaceae bacterium]|nr:recombinase family protein [Porticoccaceae bacterium]